MHWSDEQLRDLPVKGAFRMRGRGMTRLETFVDAAFAFAITMLVISIDNMPRNWPEMVDALKGAPAFALSFAQIMLFWWGHRTWSQRYGLEDGLSTLVSLGLVFIVLVYVYPLKIIYSSFFAWMTDSWLPSNFDVANLAVTSVFVVFGVGFAALAGALMLLYMRARKKTSDLNLSPVEFVRTSQEIVVWGVLSGTGLVSAAFAGLTPPKVGVYAGFIYFSLWGTNWYLYSRYQKLVDAQADSDR